jgi:hypothetical protein
MLSAYHDYGTGTGKSVLSRGKQNLSGRSVFFPLSVRGAVDRAQKKNQDGSARVGHVSVRFEREAGARSHDTGAWRITTATFHPQRHTRLRVAFTAGVQLDRGFATLHTACNGGATNSCAPLSAPIRTDHSRSQWCVDESI